MSLYLAVTVFIYLAGQTPDGPSDTDKGNLEIMIRAMEAIAKHHTVTHAFLQQACIDIEKNGLSDVLHLPQLQKYRNLFGGVASNIPLIARSPIAAHSAPSSYVPGQGPHPWTAYDSNAVREQGEQFSRNLAASAVRNTACFKPLLAPAGRNIRRQTEANAAASNKPGYISPTSAPDSDKSGAEDSQRNKKYTAPFWPGQPQMPTFGGVSIPDRTTPSSKSSPMNQGIVTEAASRETSETSSNTAGVNVTMSLNAAATMDGMNGMSSMNGMSGMNGMNEMHGMNSMDGGSSLNGLSLGLGNTPEENRIDLRDFQGRVSTPLWPMNSSEDVIFGHITESMMGDISGGTSFLHFLHDSAMDWNNTNNSNNADNGQQGS